MKIAIIGYGKMGQIINSIALERGHEIVITIDKEENYKFDSDEFKTCDVAIEFTLPESVKDNIYNCIMHKVPVVSGTTGWYKELIETRDYCLKSGGTMFYSSNFSLGVNIFFEINKRLAQLMNHYDEYDMCIHETHHNKKIDAPSGTAVTLAEDIVSLVERKSSWIVNKSPESDELQVTSGRLGSVNGEHTISYDSSVDSIEIKHKAKSRRGFAIGAVMAAEFIKGKTGVYNMNDLLKNIW